MAVHFVGFRGDEFNRAMAIFGPPDFVHRYLDRRMMDDVAPWDTVVFANGAERRFHEHTFNDSEHF